MPDLIGILQASINRIHFVLASETYQEFVDPSEVLPMIDHCRVNSADYFGGSAAAFVVLGAKVGHLRHPRDLGRRDRSPS